ncbi:MAG: hypothetical protein L0215_02200 [Gemmataceae bacterium]|nr:hypothetical protein [Gemmataceae bacterium]
MATDQVQVDAVASTLAATDPGPSQPHLVVTVHGIRTVGHWQERLGILLQQREPQIKTFHYKYGYFSVIAFLIPLLRWLVTRRFRHELKEQLKNYPKARIDIVAHSFGTHLVGWGLMGIAEDKRPSINTIVLAGSVLKNGFPWGKLIRDGKVRRVLNECGTQDWVLVINQLLVLGTGMAGLTGFTGMTGESLTNRFHCFGHSGYFQDAQRNPSDCFMQQWIAVLTTDAAVPSSPMPTSVSGLRLFLLQNAEPIKLVLWVTPLVLLVLLIYNLKTEADQQREAAQWAEEQVRRIREELRLRQNADAAERRIQAPPDPQLASVFSNADAKLTKPAPASMDLFGLLAELLHSQYVHRKEPEAKLIAAQIALAGKAMERLDAALAAWRKAWALHDQLLKQYPEASKLKNLGSFFPVIIAMVLLQQDLQANPVETLQQEDLKDALAYQKQMVRTAKEIEELGLPGRKVEGPAVTAYQAFAQTLGKRARFWEQFSSVLEKKIQETGTPHQALLFSTQAIEFLQTPLVHPVPPKTKLRLSLAYTKLAQIQQDMGQWNAARASFHKAVTFGEEAVQADRDDVRAWLQWAQTLTNLGHLESASTQDLAAETAWFERGLQVLRDAPATAKTVPAYHSRLTDLETVCSTNRSFLDAIEGAVTLTGSLAREGRHAIAANMAEELAQSDPKNAFLRLQVARCYVELVAALDRTTSKDLVANYALRAIENIQQALDLGYQQKNAAQIAASADWDPIRRLPEFQKLFEQRQ